MKASNSGKCDDGTGCCSTNMTRVPPPSLDSIHGIKGLEMVRALKFLTSFRTTGRNPRIRLRLYKPTRYYISNVSLLIKNMAPDLNSPASNGRWDYSKPGSSGYDIPNIIYYVTIHTYHHISRGATKYPLGSVILPPSRHNNRCWFLRHPNGLSDPEILRKRRACHL